jgi:DNA polymerase sigma
VASRPTSARGNPLAAVSVATASAQKRLPGSRARTTDDDNHEPFVLLNDEQLLRDPQFVDRLFFSPLSRAGTPRDLILRRIGQSVQTAYTARFGIELIGPNKRGDKGAKKRRKAAAAATPSAAPAAAVSSSSAAAPPSKPIAAAPVQELRPTQLHQQHRLLQRERQRAAQKQHETEQAGAERVTDAAAVTVDVAAAAAVPAQEASASTACAEEDECDGATTPPPSMTQAMTAIADEALKEIVDSVERQAPPPARSIRRQRSSTSEIERTVSREPVIDADDESPMPLETAAAAATTTAAAAAAAGAAKPSAGGSVRRARRKEQRNSLTNSSSEPAFVIEEPFGAAKSRSLPRATAAIAQSPPRASADDEADLSADKRPRAISLTGARAKTASTSPTKASSTLLGDDWAIVQRRRRAASPPPSGAADRERLSRRQTSGSAIGTKKPAAAAVQRPWREAAETADDWSVGARRGRYTWSALSLSKKRSPTEAVPPTPPPAAAAASAAASASASAVVSPPKTATPPLNRGKPQSFNWPVLTRMRSSGAAAASTNDDWSIGFQSRVAAAAAAAPPALAGASSSGATGHSLPATPRPRGMSSLSLSSQLSPLSAAFVRPRAPSLRSIPGMELIIGAFNCVRISVESSDASLRSLSSSSSSMPATAFQSPPVLSPRASFSAADEWVDFSESESVSSVSGSWQTAEEVLSEYGDAIDESLRPVWMPSHRLHYAHDRHDVQLHVEIEDFVCFIYACFLARLNRQQQMIQRVRSAVARLWAGAHVEVYGSYSTCLSIPSSDLDLVVIMPSGGAASPLLLPTAAAAADAPALRPVTSLIPHAPPAMPPHVVLGAVRQHPDALLSPMRQLADELRARGSVRELKLIESAAIPVIKLKTDAERIPTDITFHFENASVASAHSGIAARELVKDLLGRLPPLSALTLVTKQLLHERRLNETFSGGLGSYCLVLLVAVFLDAANNEHKISSPQLGPRRSVRNRSNSNPAAPDLGGGSVAAADAAFEQRKTLGTLLLNLCDFYGSRFDPKTTGVSWSVARGCGLLFPLCHTAPVVPAPLVLLDPYNELRNIAYNAFNFHMVQALFADVAKALRATDAREPTLLSRVVRLNAKDLD